MKNKKLFAILTLVCFMFTLMPMAAFAANPVAIDTSAYVAVDGDQTVKANAAEPVVFTFAGNDASTNATNEQLNFTVWAVDENGAVSSALLLYRDAACTTLANAGNVANTYDVTGANDYTWYAKFARAGVYTVYAGVVEADTTADLANAQFIGGSKANFSTITVTGRATDPEQTYSAKVDAVNNVTDNYTVVPVAGGAVAASGLDLTLGTLTMVPNNVQSDNITVTFYDGTQKLTGATVAIDTNSANIEVNKATAKTNILGQVQFKVAAAREGSYEIYLSVNGIEYVLKVNAGNTVATHIVTEDAPKAPIALFEGIAGEVSFTVTDINGNIVKAANAADAQGMDGIFNGTKYLVFTEKPAASTLTNNDLGLVWDDADQDYNLTVGSLDAEGTYAVKVILDNGAFATATWEAKRFQTPVSMYIYEGVPAQVELGRSLAPAAKYVDINGVEKVARDAKFAANGYAIQTYAENPFKITLKTDEKYVGAEVVVTAVSERYDLVCSSTAKIVDAVGIAFEKSDLEVNVNNKVDWFVCDADGKLVRVNNVDATKTKTTYVVLDKPEGAKVSVNETKPFANSEGQFALTSDKVGNVTVQVICQVQLTNNNGVTTNQTKYYTGTQIFAVGTEGVGDVVVMSVGSNEIVINDAKAKIDAAPIVENNRTFVPFRALAEAFGATVAYDEATQAVTAELNGVTVVMTIGSAEYTVNGVAKTADVAPFINGSRTMVPVRFAAEAFGIKVIPTYDENGATADILFNL